MLDCQTFFHYLTPLTVLVLSEILEKREQIFKQMQNLNMFKSKVLKWGHTSLNTVAVSQMTWYTLLTYTMHAVLQCLGYEL